MKLIFYIHPYIKNLQPLEERKTIDSSRHCLPVLAVRHGAVLAALPAGDENLVSTEAMINPNTAQGTWQNQSLWFALSNKQSSCCGAIPWIEASPRETRDAVGQRSTDKPITHVLFPLLLVVACKTFLFLDQ